MQLWIIVFFDLIVLFLVQSASGQPFHSGKDVSETQKDNFSFRFPRQDDMIIRIIQKARTYIYERT